MRKLLGFSAALLAVALTACGGGGDDTPVAKRVDGILDGTLTRNSTTYALHAVVSHGRFMAYDTGGRFYDSVYEVNGVFTDNGVSVFDVNSAYGDSFDHVGFFNTAMSFSATETADGWQGTIGTDSYALTYDRDLDSQDSALSFIADNWLFTNAQYATALTVGSDGTTSTSSTYAGNVYNCSSAGTASLIQAQYGLYGWETTTTGSACANSTYTGLAFLSDGAAPLDTLNVLLASGTQFLAFRFTRQ